VESLAAKKSGSLLAIDADPNSNLPELLGLKSSKTVVGMIDEISKNMGSIPQGMTKDRYIEMKMQQDGVAEEDRFDLLAMGRPEGPGCYCYVNNLLRGIVAKITKNYDFVVIDNAAGMEHISRRTERVVDKLVLVSDFSVFGVRSASNIYQLAKDLNIKIGGAYLILNKLTGPADSLAGEIRDSGLSLAGTIPYENDLGCLSLANRPIFELKSEQVKSAVDDILKNLMRG